MMVACRIYNRFSMNTSDQAYNGSKILQLRCQLVASVLLSFNLNQNVKIPTRNDCDNYYKVPSQLLKLNVFNAERFNLIQHKTGQE